MSASNTSKPEDRAHFVRQLAELKEKPQSNLEKIGKACNNELFQPYHV
jgi:hypothetical protein